MSTQFTNRQWRLPNNENKDKQSNYSMDFDAASSDYINVGNPTELQITGALTISAWIKTTNTITAGVIVGKDGVNPHSTRSYQIQHTASGEARFVIFKSSSVVELVTGTTIINDGNWHNIIGINDGANLKIYVDGTLEDTNVGGGGTIQNGTANLNIGRRQGNGANELEFSGKIDAVSIFNYALTDGTGGTVNQIAALYGSSSTGIGNPMAISGGGKPVAFYQLGDKSAFNGANYLVPNSSLKDFVFDFDGSNDYIDCGQNTNLDTGDLSASIWINKDSTGSGTQYIFNNNNGSSIAGFSILMNGTNRVYLYRNTGTYSAATGYTNVSFTTDTWHHLCFTYNDTTKSFVAYFNGVSFHTSTATSSSGGASQNIIIGTNSGLSGANFDGQISNAQIFNTALPATGSNSVETLYNNGSPLTSMTGFTSLQGWWKLDASDIYDSSTGNWTIEDHAGTNDGTSSGMTQANLVQSDLSFTSGYSPYALSFDSASRDYIDCGTGLGNSLGTVTSLSVSVWIKTSTTGLNEFPFYIGNFSNSYGAFNIYTINAAVQIMLNNNAYSVAVQNVDLNDWKNIIFVYDGSNENNSFIYINGQQQINSGSGTFPSSINLSGLKTLIGAGYNTPYSFDGKISNASYWNTALTSTQVSEIYSEGIPQNLNNHSAYSNLVSWWQLGSNSSFNSSLNQWTCIDEKGTNTGESSQTFNENAIVDGVGSYANGLSSGMGGDEVIGSAPFSDANSLSINMDVEDRVTDTPS